MSLRLGIDTGGTFTDAVLVDDQRNIIHAAKSLTTRFDLSLGIGDVIAKLPRASLVDISMVSLSTTLTTNSVVEDLGHRCACCCQVITRNRSSRAACSIFCRRRWWWLWKGGTMR